MDLTTGFWRSRAGTCSEQALRTLAASFTSSDAERSTIGIISESRSDARKVGSPVPQGPPGASRKGASFALYTDPISLHLIHFPQRALDRRGRRGQ